MLVGALANEPKVRHPVGVSRPCFSVAAIEGDDR